MTKKKRMQLEAEERRRTEQAERAARQAAEQQGATTLYGGMTYGDVNGFSVPVARGQIKGIQLPPIIQPISLSFLPFSMPGNEPQPMMGDAQEEYDDFDGDDWF